jgi:predicted lipoprotein with Yx(FWY)xxD motif
VKPGTGVVLLATIALAWSGVAPPADAGASAVAATHTASAVTIRVEQTSLGEILTDGSGHTLYVFTRDRHGADSCAKVPGCLETWPALTTTRRPIAGVGVRASLLGTVKLHGHVRQVTYAGHPLYTYALDFVRRSTYNIGADQYGGEWYAVDAAGKAVS